ncbi:hypothetical protein K458DRAFT_412209 [Lentithecium fluviatile CBS 122367]|uniref:Uncharacterized protein n=1 Tax=Lentithecium fluviatile CBS 122367 TaxID=1168545 RepID=A0A6G1JL66_9PLEO|nr:hypothetical protein K458DRAFT_412209 [Lentithecium fluviatile CBS 122367]
MPTPASCMRMKSHPRESAKAELFCDWQAVRSFFVSSRLPGSVYAILAMSLQCTLQVVMSGLNAAKRRLVGMRRYSIRYLPTAECA